MFLADYPLVWQIYLAVAAVCLLTAFFLFKGLWRPIHHLLIIFLAVLLFSPTLVSNENNFMIYAPSSIIVFLDLAFKTGNLAAAAISNLIWHAAICCGVYVPIAILLALWHKKRTPIKQKDH